MKSKLFTPSLAISRQVLLLNVAGDDPGTAHSITSALRGGTVTPPRPSCLARSHSVDITSPVLDVGVGLSNTTRDSQQNQVAP
jgi:hypothetical protein